MGGKFRKALVGAFLLPVIVAVTSGCDTASSKSNAQAEGSNKDSRPNVVILFADDLGYGDLGSFGHPYIRTPRIDSLAAEGQRWTDFYVAAPVCSPSRAALLTGRLPVRSGLYGNSIRVYFPGEPGGLPQGETTLAEALKSQGYATAMFGKWHLGDAPHALPTRHGFDEWEGVPYSNDMNWVDEPDFDALVKMSLTGDTAQRAAAYARRAAKYANPLAAHFEAPLFFSKATPDGFVDGVEQPADQTQLTRRATESAVDFIRRSADRPFFLYMPYSMPHTPLFRSDEFVDRSLGGRYGDVVEEIDWSVGAIHDALAEAGVLENTLVVFTSDNGPWLFMREEGGVSGLLRDGKGTTFEGGVRVPTVFYWPGTIAAEVVSDIGSAMDLFSTVMALVGGDAQSATDGMDLSSRLLGQGVSPRVEMPYYRGGSLYAYRKGPWKLHFITEGAYGLPPKRQEHDSPQLYHLHRDPAERFNVASQHPEVVADMLAAVAAHKARVSVAPPLLDARLAALMPQAQP
jgi:arylsulfatase A-like enzyme